VLALAPPPPPMQPFSQGHFLVLRSLFFGCAAVLHARSPGPVPPSQWQLGAGYALDASKAVAQPRDVLLQRVHQPACEEVGRPPRAARIPVFTFFVALGVGNA
jgi:hypothetical protein